MASKDKHLIWLDLEMTGLDTTQEVIIEIATVVTDKDLDIIAEGPDLVIHQPEHYLEAMDEWNTRQHGQSGLTTRVRESTVSLGQAENQTLDFLKKHTASGKSPMCGNSICMDRRFLCRYMPQLEQHFHYRHVDVSTVKELARRWKPSIMKGQEKKSAHLALSDIYDSINELRYYREHFFS